MKQRQIDQPLLTYYALNFTLPPDFNSTLSTKLDHNITLLELNVWQLSDVDKAPYPENATPPEQPWQNGSYIRNEEGHEEMREEIVNITGKHIHDLIYGHIPSNGGPGHPLSRAGRPFEDYKAMFPTKQTYRNDTSVNWNMFNRAFKESPTLKLLVYAV